MATIGVFLLWFGWYGFNGGSVLSAEPVGVSYVFVTTTLATAAGVLSAAILSWNVDGKPDLGMALNGALAGLVGITAGADVVSVQEAVFIGVVAGPLVWGGIKAADAFKVDDPVSAVAVHLVCGIWGTLAVGLFGTDKSVVAQLMGIAATGLLCVPSSLLMMFALDKLFGLRVSEHEEHEGLDLGEHGELAYADFVLHYRGTEEADEPTALASK